MNLRPHLQRFLLPSNDFKVVQYISRGAFGEVNLVENKTTHEQFAAKTILASDGNNKENVKLISREISILSRFHVPTIIRFYGYSTTDFKDRPFITLFLEYKNGGSLQTLLEKERNHEAPPDYNNTAKQIILCGIAHGMMTLHSRRVLHRDLKPDNILLDSNYRPSITDFGLSKILDNSNRESINLCGTMPYMAPEIFDGNHYSTKSDVYSFGILMFEVLTGEKAFGKQIDKKSFIKFGNEVCQGKRPVFKTPIKQSFKQLIEQCWSANPRQRPTFRDLYHKLSLILDDEDETVKESSNPVHNEEEENEEENSNDEYGYFRYFLDEVDVDKVLDYFEELSEVQQLKSTEHEKQIEIFKQEINSMKQHYQEEIEKQTNHIKELQKENEIIKHKYQQEVEEQTKFNNEIKQEINSMKQPYQEEIEKQTNSVKELQQVNEIIKHKYQQEVEEQAKFNNEIQQEINSMKQHYQEEIEKQTNHVKELQQELNSIYGKLNETKKQFQTIDFGKEEISSVRNAVTELQKFLFVSDDFILKDLKSKVQDFELTQITIPSSVTSIGENAFYNCSSLTQITIPSSVTSIGENAFSNCNSLTQITIPSSVTSIGDNSFYNCSSLTQITIPSSVTSIPESAFSNCSSLTEITIPSSVASIGENAFSNCSSLRQITIPSSVTSIAKNPFAYCSNLEQLKVAPDNSQFISVNDVLFTKDQRTLICYPPKHKGNTYSIPSSVTSIGDNAFYNCSSLTEITILSSVTSIGKYAFFGCSSLAQIHDITDFKFFSHPPKVLSIRKYTFSNCSSLKKIKIPYTVTSIGENAFSNCSSLTEIYIPSSVTSIAKNAFSGCSSLKSLIKMRSL